MKNFLDFVSTDRVTGEILACNIKSTLVKYGLEFEASNMSARHGVQGILSGENNKALYVHCNSHILNLCIVQACSLRSIRNMNGTVTESSFFFKNSPKRQTFLEFAIDKQTKSKKVKDLCRTRWVPAVIKPLSIKLQNRTNDVVYAYSKIKDVIEELKLIRANEELLHLWYEQAKSQAGSIGVEPQVPRIVGRQLGGDTVQYSSAEDYTSEGQLHCLCLIT